MNQKTLQITAISDGTVIDHISKDNTFKVADFLNLKDGGDVVTVGMNLESKRLGKKGLIKIGGRFLTKEEVNKIALIAPEANINIIKGYTVKNKFKVEIPDVINGIIKCANTNCITNKEFVRTKFYVLGKDPLKLRCHYCERVVGKEDIELV
ncbi:MAG: aspartate carbamoyltransferase regulatory subunit [Candidatus Aenigmatarchaeota archaeon]|nr:MAG: aspartate carbamoyltransferase regulatory subunit [Candidatus Aenigmarchaeota archaeon]